MKHIVTPEMMRQAEEEAFKNGLDPKDAMERAGTFVFEEVKFFKKVLVVCFSGNNGGDGFVCAQRLNRIGITVHVLLLGNTEKLSRHADFFYNKIKELIVQAPDNDYDCIVDALFGIGFRGELTGEVLRAVEFINSFKNKAKIISVDIPSGLDGLTGEYKASVDADITITFQAVKTGLIINKGARVAGEIKVRDIGISVPYIAQAVEKEDIEFPKVQKTAHKGTQGHIGVIAGSFGMEGAAMLASGASIKSGAGKVSLAVSEDIKNNFALREREVMLTLREDAFILDKDVVLYGCGMGRREDNKKLLEFLIESCTKKLVIDADGLFFITREMLKKARCEIILTPHMGEASRLFGVDIKELQKNPIEITKAFARDTGVTVLLKSNYNLITDGNETYISSFGCPAMATAGSGDVLAGICATMAHIMPTGVRACINASYIHGTAGNFAQKEKGVYGTCAGDILNNIYKGLMK